MNTTQNEVWGDVYSTLTEALCTIEQISLLARANLYVTNVMFEEATKAFI